MTAGADSAGAPTTSGALARPAALQPFVLKGLELRNRIVRTAHGTNLGRGQLSDALIAFHEARARGGVALSILEATGVHPSGPMTLNAWDDAIVPRYRELARRMHAHGMRIFSQLNHLGLEQGAPGERPWSASPLVAPHTGQRALAMDAERVAAVVAGFAAAARRAREGGLDGVEIHCAHGHLLQQFLSPLANRRDDAYGGDDERRRRFLLEVLRACRDAVGDDYVVGIRVGPQRLAGGLGVPEHVALVEWLERSGLVDYVSVSHGNAYAPHRIIGGMHEPAGYELADAAPVTAATRLPTIVTGRLRTVAEASDVIARGIADLVGLTRAHIADPDLVAKTLAGRASDVRPCIACNQGCVGGLARGRLGCTVNAAAGRELELETVAQAAGTSPRRRAPGPLVVLGGGPAGMEAARVAREHAADVVLLEAAPELGGALGIARRAPHHAAIGDAADWLARELGRLRVDVRLGLRGDVESARALGASRVLVATGAAPGPLEQRYAPGLPRIATSTMPTLGARELLASPDGGPASVRRALVLDDLGTYEGIAAAELLVSRGVEVVYVTGDRSFAPRLESALVPGPALERLRRGAFTLHTRACVRHVDRRECTLSWLEGGEPWQEPADLFVAALPGWPADPLVAALRAAGLDAVAIGDARHPGTLEHAIHAGHAAALEWLRGGREA